MIRTAKFELVWRRVGCKDDRVIERILRAAHSFEEVEEFDRQDMARLSLEERVSAVEQLRRTWFGEASARPQHLQESPPPCRNAPHHDGESLPPPRKRGLRHPQA